MAIAELRPFLEDARKNKYCLGCFNVFNIETLEGVVEAAINFNTPIVVAVYEPQFKFGDMEIFSGIVKDISNRVNVPVILHLDHAQEVSSIIRAIRCGFTSVMYDGPLGISFREKKDKTRNVVDIAHSVNVMVEAELGYIARVGENEEIAGENYADPDLAGEFVEYTGIDILAPAIGTIHGQQEGKATLNLDLLNEIRSKTNCFLSLHGGSGVERSIVEKAIGIGINKASVYTRISRTAIDRLKKVIGSESLDLSVLLNEVRNGFRESVEEMLGLFGSKNICSFDSNICNFCSSTKYCVKPLTGENQMGEKKDFRYSELIEKITEEIIKNYKEYR